MNAPEPLPEQQRRDRVTAGTPDSGFRSRLVGPIGVRILDRIDRGLAAGSIEGHLPNGEMRMLGARRPGPHAVVHVKSWNALVRLARAGSVGWYEAWAAGEWESPDPVPLFDLFMRNRKELGQAARASGWARLAGKAIHWAKRNNKPGARRNIEFHYDLGNDFYAAWLDPSMTYSSAVFADAGQGGDLQEAQHRKNALLLERLNLSPGQNMLEIGCGWGSLAEQALRESDIEYRGITLSTEQKSFADKRLLAFGRAATVSITDYRDVEEQFDAIASVEMVEAVGQRYWPDYVDCIARNLKRGGRAAIQYIRIEDDVFDAYAHSQDFIQRYIFPGGMLLSESRFRALAKDRGLSWQDQLDFGLHYAETLRQWRKRFDRAASEGCLPQIFDEKFTRLWRYYLMYCEGGFRGGGINVAQVTLVKE